MSGVDLLSCHLNGHGSGEVIIKEVVRLRVTHRTGGRPLTGNRLTHFGPKPYLSGRPDPGTEEVLIETQNPPNELKYGRQGGGVLPHSLSWIEPPDESPNLLT